MMGDYCWSIKLNIMDNQEREYFYPHSNVPKGSVSAVGLLNDFNENTC